MQIQTAGASGFGARIKGLRIAAGLTQAELAERAKVSERTISDIERGLRRTVYPATARQLAASLGVGADELAGFLSEARGRQPDAGHVSDLSAIPAGHRTRLPTPLTRLLGREQDLEVTLRLVRDPASRLVTIVGPGGIGKTRLAIEAAGQVESDFAGGTYFISLSVIDDPAMVLPQIANAVGVGTHSTDLESALAARLSAHPTLLVLDTFEHVVDAAASVGDLLEACPLVTVIATSRTPLHIRGEHEVPLQPLAVRSDAPQTQMAPAVELFLERAAAVEPSFAETAATDVATEICAQLDGLPLAIELAAARVRHMPLGDLRRQLEHRLDPLVSGARDLPERQRTMRRTLDWSYAILEPAEMRLFRALAAFRGGFGPEQVVEIVRPTEDSDGADLIASMAVLVDSSLVLAGSGASGRGRYRMLDVTREYAVERSTAAGEYEALRRQHADCFLALAETAEPWMRSDQQQDWFSLLLDDEGNFRSALNWALEHGEGETALRLAGALWMFWRWAGLFTEGRTLLEAALRAGVESPLAVRCQGIWGAGWLAYHQDDYKRTAELGAEMLALIQGRDDKLLRRNGLTLVGNAALAEGRIDEAVGALREALTLSQSEGSKWHLATSLLNLGTAELRRGRADAAMELFERALATYEELGDRHFAARALIQEGYASLAMSEPASADGALRQAMAMVAEQGDGWSIAEGLEAIATLRSDDDPRGAALLAGAAAQLRERISMRQHPADAVINQHYLEQARKHLGSDVFQQVFTEGRDMSLEDAIDLATGP